MTNISEELISSTFKELTQINEENHENLHVVAGCG